MSCWTSIAARMEALAEGGGICISSTVYDAIAGKLGLGFDFLGEQQVKNIAQPVRVYRVRAEPAKARHPPRAGRMSRRIAVAASAVALVLIAGGVAWQLARERAPEHLAPAGSAPALPDRPTIAVLRFENASGDPEQDYFADGIADDIITNLSVFDGIGVIARNSSFQYRGASVDVRTIGEELSARYVLEGSVRRSGDSLRITAQLLDARDGSHVWAKRFDRSVSVSAIFEMQDQITAEIAGTLGGALGVIAESGAAEARRKPPETLASYECVLLGQQYMRIFSPEAHLTARGCLEAAIAREPDYADAWAWLGHLHDDTHSLGFNPIPDPLERAREALERALALSPRNQKAHWEMAVNRFFRGDIEGFFQEVDVALEINPNNAHAKGDLAIFVAWAGSLDKAVKMVDEASRLDPVPRFQTQLVRYLANFRAGRFQQAVSEITKAATPDLYWYQANLAAAYGHLGDTARANEAVAELENLNPDFAANARRELSFWTKDEVYLQLFVEGWRKAGLDIRDEPVEAAKP